MAALIANALADELILIEPARDLEQQQFIEQQLEDLLAKINEIGNQIDVLSASLDELTSGAEIQDTQDRIAASEQMRAQYQSTYARLFAIHQQPVPDLLALLEPADAPQQPVPRKTGLIVGFAGLAGLEVTSGVVSLARYLRRYIQGAKYDAQ
jgi:hypothetical protein